MEKEEEKKEKMQEMIEKTKFDAAMMETWSGVRT